MSTSPPRRYEETHPWIDFKFTVRQDRLWQMLGEAYSKCEHLCGTPLKPALAQKFADVYMVKGAVATTAIEGNTLTEEVVMEIRAGQRQLPESQKYLQVEVENVLRAMNVIDADVVSGHPLNLTSKWIREQNREILDGLELEPEVIPGEFRTHSVGVGSYLAVPAEDCEFLMEKLAEWLNQLTTHPVGTSSSQRFVSAVLAAVVAHLYLAWIHAFGDGNGRTARLVEFAILAHSGVVPLVAANLLSDHYNKTRGAYYRALERSSRERDVNGFVLYAVQGFIDGLREQIADVQEHQRTASWVNFVHEVFGSTSKLREPSLRQKTLVLAMPTDEPTAKSEMRYLTPRLAEMYAGKGDKTLTRDLNVLKRLGLIRQRQNSFIPAIRRLDAFLPPTTKTQ